MKQTRNLIINLFLNLLLITGVVSLSLYIGPDTFNYSLSFYIVNLLYIFLLSCLGMIFSASSKSYLRRKYPMPTCLFILIFYLVQYLLGDAKKIRFTNGKLYSRFYNEEIIVYYISPFYVEKIGSYGYSGTPENLLSIKSYLDSYFYTNHIATSKLNYRKWDGALDAESKRMNTIDNIIK